jgi:hypothetical protein
MKETYRVVEVLFGCDNVILAHGMNADVAAILCTALNDGNGDDHYRWYQIEKETQSSET